MAYGKAVVIFSDRRYIIRVKLQSIYHYPWWHSGGVLDLRSKGPQFKYQLGVTIMNDKNIIRVKLHIDSVVHKKVTIRSRYSVIHKKVTIRSRHSVIHKKVTIRSR